MLYDAGRQPCMMARQAGERCRSRSSRYRFESDQTIVHLCEACGDGEPGQRLEAAGFSKTPIEGVTFLPATTLAEQAAYAQHGGTYAILTDHGETLMFCRLCSHVVRDPQDVRQRYCVSCNRYHLPRGMTEAEQRRYADLNMVPPAGSREGGSDAVDLRP